MCTRMTQQLIQGHNGYCTVIGNDLFAYFSSGKQKSENYLRLLRGPHEDYVLNETHNYLIANYPSAIW